MWLRGHEWKVTPCVKKKIKKCSFYSFTYTTCQIYMNTDQHRQPQEQRVLSLTKTTRTIVDGAISFRNKRIIYDT